MPSEKSQPFGRALCFFKKKCYFCSHNMESTLNTSQYRSLTLDITAKDVSYLIYGSDQAIESGTITLDGTAGDYRKAIENAVYDNPFLLNDYQRITISLHARHFLIIPQEIEHLARKMMESSFTKIEGDILTCHIADTSASVACDVETGVEAFLRRTFPTSLILHHLAPLATYCARAYGEDTACMHVAIDNEEVHIVVIKHGKLLMANTYFHRNLEDAVYYVLNAWKTCSLDNRHDKLQLSGDNTLRTKLAEQLRQWIAYAMPEVLPAQALKLGRDAINIPFKLLTLALYENN